jgi:16S rRNA (cytidine1402-2'-O)-methyltransferase
MSAGILYLVSTPIGNLKDMTFRALETLQEADIVVAEDTRHTIKLLSHFSLKKRLESYHDHSDEDKRRKLIAYLKEGQNLALVSDAGTPLVSDPGFKLVRECVREGIAVCPIPGPSAVIAALSASGLATDRFYFQGFLSNKTVSRKKTLAELQTLECTLIFYESCHRLVSMLQDALEVLGSRRVAVCRELTKQFEEIFRGSLTEAISHFDQKTVKGEIVVCVEGKV